MAEKVETEEIVERLRDWAERLRRPMDESDRMAMAVSLDCAATLLEAAIARAQASS
jgi:hypothetical protein